MTKRGAYQKAKERKNKTSVILFSISAVFLTALLLWTIVQSAVTVHNIDNGTYQTYSGAFTYRIDKGYGRHRSTLCHFTLDNGDNLAINASLVENEEKLENLETLTFYYSTFPISISGRYSIIAISSPDSSVDFVTLQETRADDIGKIWVFSILFVLWAALCTLVFMIPLRWRTNRKK